MKCTVHPCICTVYNILVYYLKGCFFTNCVKTHLQDRLLALLDYVSRAHEIEIHQSSLVRPSVASIISEVTAWISFKFHLWLPLGHMPRCFFQKFFFDFLRIFFIFVNMGPYGSQNIKMLLLPQITFASFQTFSVISEWSSQKVLFWIFEIRVYYFSRSV